MAKKIENQKRKNNVFSLELNKTYDLVYHHSFMEIEYLNSVTINKITPKMYFIDLPNGKSIRIPKDSLLEVKIKE